MYIFLVTIDKHTAVFEHLHERGLWKRGQKNSLANDNWKARARKGGSEGGRKEKITTQRHRGHSGLAGSLQSLHI